MSVTKVNVNDLQRGDVIAIPNRETRTIDRFQVSGVATAPHEHEDGRMARAVFGVHHGPKDVPGSVTFVDGAEVTRIRSNEELLAER